MAERISIDACASASPGIGFPTCQPFQESKLKSLSKIGFEMPPKTNRQEALNSHTMRRNHGWRAELCLVLGQMVVRAQLMAFQNCHHAASDFTDLDCSENPASVYSATPFTFLRTRWTLRSPVPMVRPPFPSSGFLVSDSFIVLINPRILPSSIKFGGVLSTSQRALSNF